MWSPLVAPPPVQPLDSRVLTMDPTGFQPPSNPQFGHILLPNANANGAAPAPAPAAAHRRAQSETFMRLPGNLLVDSDPDFQLPDIDFSSFSDDTISGGGVSTFLTELARPDPPAAAGATAAAVTAAGLSRPAPPEPHLRSLSVDGSLFEALKFLGAGAGGDRNAVVAENRGLHRQSVSVDGLNSSLAGETAPMLSMFMKKTMPPETLAQLFLIDPKRAKRIVANRQSAARSKEKKVRYTNELEQKVQSLQTESTTITAQLKILQKNNTELTSENRELKFRLQAIEQQAQLREALNETLQKEVNQLKKANAQLLRLNGAPFSTAIQQTAPNYYTHTQPLPRPINHQAQNLWTSQVQASSNGQPPSEQCLNDPMGFMRKFNRFF